MKATLTRRSFLAGAGVAGATLASAALAGCAGGAPKAAEEGQGADAAPASDAAPAPIADADIDETRDAEVCIVGAGVSGVVAALACAEEGLQVAVMQKKSAISTQGTGASCIGSRRQKELGLETGSFEDLMRLKAAEEGGLVNYDLFKLWYDRSGEALDWVCDRASENGVDAVFDQIANWEEADDWVKTTQISSMFSGEGGVGASALIEALYPLTLDAGVQYVFDTTARQLVRDDDGRVIAVIGQKKDGGYVRINASKAVVICSGGYENNPEMRQKYLPHAMRFDNISDNDGEGIQMGLWAGAAIDPAPHASNIHYNVSETDAYGSAIPWLRVGVEGTRLGNEDIAYGFLPFLDLKSKEACCFQVFDPDFDAYYEKMLVNGCGIFRSFPPAEAVGAATELETSEDTSSWSPLKKIYESCVEQGTAVKADTLEELAQKAGIDAAGLQATVKRYNELYDSGADSDYGKKFSRMHAVRTPPFYAIRRQAYVLGTLGGLVINENMQVMDTEGEVIPGLFAAGNASGGRFFGTPAQGMAVPASTISRALTWGYLASKYIAENE